MGQKYGHFPLPYQITAFNFQLIRTVLLANQKPIELLDQWYKEDTNTVPPTYILQPISSYLANYNNMAVKAELQAQDEATWSMIYQQIQQLLWFATDELIATEKMTVNDGLRLKASSKFYLLYNIDLDTNT